MKKQLKFCYFIALCSLIWCGKPIYASDLNDAEALLKKSIVKENKQETKRVFEDELAIFETTNKENNLDALLSKDIVSKDDLALCGLKGTIEIKENKYYITYTSDDNIIVSQTSLLEEIDEIGYSIGNISVLKELNEESDIIGEYFFNEKIKLKGEFGDWYQVEYKDQIGYIKNYNVSENSLRLKRENGKTCIYSGDEKVGLDLTKITLNRFSLTAYCGCEICCGRWSAAHKTASGTTPLENHTIAVDTKVIPMGASVEIDGMLYRAEDTGSAINGYDIDIYMESHQDAKQFGRRTRDISIMVN